MRNRSYSKFVVASLLVLAPASKIFAATECTHGKSTRKIAISYDDKDKKLPCAVKYTKEDGVEKEVATAKAEAGICEQKAKNLADKLTGFGWKCEEK